jgi:hypothetical protein
MKYLALALIGLSMVGCRAVTSKSSVSNTFTAGRDVILTKSGTEGLQEGTQAADKEVGDISPNTSVAPK